MEWQRTLFPELLQELRREEENTVRARQFSGEALEQAEESREALLLPTDSFFRSYAPVALSSPRQEKLCRNGNPVPVRELEEEALYRVYSQEGDFLCLSRYQKGYLVSVKNFFGS